jgi:hypothetical protein
VAARTINDPNVPPHPAVIKFKHPGNDETFLHLPCNNVLPTGVTRTFGVHNGTALAACEILAKERGFLSTSRNRGDMVARAPQDLDELLTGKTYYYHLSNVPSDTLYPICLDFSLWRFPHRDMPVQWRTVNFSETQEPIEGSDWTAISARIKGRDSGRCRVSGWRDSVKTAHIVPRKETVWVSTTIFLWAVSQDRMC